ncbi:hypothetical protein EHW99_3117 [Erwinia amylovora]|uniref:Uncharacterized protein n=1 Tax=Erwinia amylovora (strain CFBP1430) TaxID=665029 RepID=D4HVD0_ERWAC|nr:hypothetical protein EHX00_3117 [Erwinia amylovora]CBA19411.1 hypothetical protein predicted by Glimmer/Critica [Erwinia amylovora CFBP1430]QJQ59515.1 hypothetical protein EHW99_3117 [Erwinia amylovora]QJQ63214.1 hypothetical protein EHW98_3117 [Erwinia amylovora]QJQ67016.1 hypothetical protein EHW96_3117 [Erwinia amylovora]
MKKLTTTEGHTHSVSQKWATVVALLLFIMLRERAAAW